MFICFIILFSPFKLSVIDCAASILSFMLFVIVVVFILSFKLSVIVRLDAVEIYKKLYVKLFVSSNRCARELHDQTTSEA